MAWWGWLLLALLAVLLLVAASHIQIQLHYSRMGDNDCLDVHIKGLYGLVQHKAEVPFLKFKGLAQGIDVKTEHVNETNEKLLADNIATITQEKVVRFYRNVKEILQATLGMKEWIKDTMAHVTCTGLKWDTRVGIGDAPDTAITTGVIWTLKSSVLGYLFQFIRRDMKPQVRVMPQYNQQYFSTELTCVMRIRMIQAILSGIRLISRVNKVKDGFRRWQHVMTRPLGEG